jgi:Reverse transcriptase (RNA-dependent DNA polymerase)
VDADNDPCQFGFRKEHSTTLGCSVLKDVIKYYRVNGSYVFACFLDMTKAFDMVNHHKLFDRLVKLKFPRILFKLVIFWYSNQMVNVRWKSTISSIFVMKNGTRQGSVLSPYLFSVYMRDISCAINRSVIGCHVGGNPCNILFYADDMVILAPSWKGMQLLLDLATQVVNDIDMKFNASKSVSMIFSPVNKNRHLTCIFENFVLGTDSLTFVNIFKYLGHVLTNDLHDDDDMLKQMSLLYGRTNTLIRRFSKCSVPVKLCLFKSYCLSFYGMALWKHFRKTSFLKVEAAYVKCIKMFFGYERMFSVRQMFQDLGLPTFNTLLHNSMLGFKNTCRHVNNRLVLIVHDLCTSI